MKLRSPIDIEADYDNMVIDEFPNIDDAKQLLTDTKRLLKNEKEYLTYLVDSGQTHITEAIDRDILHHQEITGHLSKVVKEKKRGTS